VISLGDVPVARDGVGHGADASDAIRRRLKRVGGMHKELYRHPIERVPKQPDVVTAELLDGLPEQVQHPMRWTGGRPPWITRPTSGSRAIRQGFDKPWMPMAAEQVLPLTHRDGLSTVQDVWPAAHASDTYQDGRGHMFAKRPGCLPSSMSAAS
jgi:hypothetical protein